MLHQLAWPDLDPRTSPRQSRLSVICGAGARDASDHVATNQTQTRVFSVASEGDDGVGGSE